MDDEANEDDDLSSSGQSTPFDESEHQEFVFSYGSAVINMRAFHPTQAHIQIMWDAYKENVDVLTKIVHVPSFEPEFLKAMHDPTGIDRPMEAMMFAIYYAAVTSIVAEDCVKILGQEKAKLMAKYRFAVEQALARASFLTSQEFMTLQALVMYLVRSCHRTRSIVKQN